jgi:adenosine deaminase
VQDEAQQGTHWVEVTFTAAAHEARLGHPEAPLEAVLEGLAEGGASTGVGWAVVPTTPAGGPWSWPTAPSTWQPGTPCTASSGWVSPATRTHALAPFAEVCAAAADRGLTLLHHAGETAGPASIREALDLGARRPDRHGIRALGDPGLVAELRDRRVPLEVCPSSNVALGLVRSAPEHPLPAMLAAGLQVTLNTDVPDVTVPAWRRVPARS